MKHSTALGKGWSAGKQFVPRQTCGYCMEPFYAPPVLIRRGGGKHCSPKCKGLATRGADNPNYRQITSECAVCSKPFNIPPSHKAKKQTCSVTCAATRRSDRSKAERVRLGRLENCAVCAKQLTPTQRKYCGQECAKATRTGKGAWNWKGGNLVNRFCDQCGSVFAANRFDVAKGMGKYCNRRCMAAWKSSHAKGTYSRGKGGRREDLNGVYFRSRWEANWARYLNVLVKHGNVDRWEFESETFEFPVKRGSRIYTPDFKVFLPNGETYFYEIKGYMDQKSATKLKRMKKYYPKIDLRLIDSKAYYEVAAKIGGAIPEWERESK